MTDAPVAGAVTLIPGMSLQTIRVPVFTLGIVTVVAPGTLMAELAELCWTPEPLRVRHTRRLWTVSQPRRSSSRSRSRRRRSQARRAEPEQGSASRGRFIPSGRTDVNVGPNSLRPAACRSRRPLSRTSASRSGRRGSGRRRRPGCRGCRLARPSCGSGTRSTRERRGSRSGCPGRCCRRGWRSASYRRWWHRGR